MLTDSEKAQLAQLKLEYQADTIDHMVYMQQATAFDPAMIDAQPELGWHMRPFLLDFLVESHLGLGLAPDSLFLAVNIVDRYTAKRVVRRKHYQLVGITALWIASKYIDKKDRIPTLGELKQLCCNAYQPQMFLQMELHILASLDWCVGHPTHDLYVDLLCDRAAQSNSSQYIDHVRQVALYICEISFYHRALIEYPTSVVATCAVELAKLIVCHARTTANPAHSLTCTCFEASDAESCETGCLRYLADSLNTASASLARKFSHPSVFSVHLLVQDYTNALACEMPSPTFPMTPPYAYSTNLPSASSISTPKPTDALPMAQDAYMTPPFTPQNCLF